MRVYLSGSIEYSADLGVSWRAELTPFLRSLGHDVYDPAADVRKNLTHEEVRDFRKWKTTDLPRFQATLRKIIAWDLDWIEQKTEYLICFFDAAAQRGAGTQGELTVAHRAGIPVCLVLGLPIEQVSGWILGCATRVFTDFQQLRTFLAAEFAAGKAAVPAAKLAAAKP